MVLREKLLGEMMFIMFIDKFQVHGFERKATWWNDEDKCGEWHVANFIGTWAAPENPTVENERRETAEGREIGNNGYTFARFVFYK